VHCERWLVLHIVTILKALVYEKYRHFPVTSILNFFCHLDLIPNKEAIFMCANNTAEDP
jgi:hypothetical protein